MRRPVSDSARRLGNLKIALLMRWRKNRMSCLFNHRWIYDFRLHFIYRKCRFCDAAQRHVRGGTTMVIEWESLPEQMNVEPEPRRVVQGHSSALLRLAHALGLFRQ